MTSTKKLCIQICLHDILCRLDSDDTCAECDNVGIIVLLNKMSGCDIRAYCCTHTVDFVRCDRDTNTGSADEHCTFHFSIRNRTSDSLTDLRMISAFRCVNTVVNNLVSEPF